jgi:hypothetical protein
MLASQIAEQTFHKQAILQKNLPLVKRNSNTPQLETASNYR